jgi:hypothetical protein
MTWRQSNNQWSGDIAAHPTPKNSDCKNLLKNVGHHFSSDTEVTAAAETWLDGQPSVFF